jgi:hypothetical protein
MNTFKPGDRVRDTRYDDLATVLSIHADHGDDGFAIVVEYDDEPNTSVSTGSDYFEAVKP